MNHRVRAKEVGSIMRKTSNKTGAPPEWNEAIEELTRLAMKFPTPRLYDQLAACYRQIDEKEEASVMSDLARRLRGAEASHVAAK